MDKVIKECLQYKASEMPISSSISIQNIINNKKRKKLSLSWVYISSPIVALALIFIFIFIPSDKQVKENIAIGETSLMQADLVTNEPTLRNNKSAASNIELQQPIGVMKMQDELIINKSSYILSSTQASVQIGDMYGKIQTNDLQQSDNLIYANSLPLGTDIFYTSDSSIFIAITANQEWLYYQKQ